MFLRRSLTVSSRKFSGTANVPTKALINNEWVDAESGSTFPVYNPTTEELICEMVNCGQAEVDAAVQVSFCFLLLRKYGLLS